MDRSIEVTVKAPAKPITAPGIPTSVTATAENGQAIITFTPPVNDGGSEITGYLVTANPGELTVSGTGSPLTISGLTNGTSYSFTVQAINKVALANHLLNPIQSSRALHPVLMFLLNQLHQQRRLKWQMMLPF
ncbi:fibronectin type III domain-containing protein [Paenibacillus pseudetheri]|uniref:Fibronectin type-III domain-containing protein n=1 Tax=Paenibacillus pseudetheri TaxID=2897682 RepID=A0ABN8FU56_9BACL|nr:fibronectin type III domain-containing protein [Paenibacillus pseudetheri]CAH1059208.1 hypothetical protein PAECIP111894_05414 [Paenibacillus pseudetheri]